MQWNVSGAFIGELEAAVPCLPINPDDDCRSLLFSTFLATAVLPSGPLFTEEKFSGNDEAGKNSGAIGEAVDAFAHHVVVTSQGTVLFADLQGIIVISCLYGLSAHHFFYHSRSCWTSSCEECICTSWFSDFFRSTGTYVCYASFFVSSHIHVIEQVQWKLRALGQRPSRNQKLHCYT